MRAKSFIKNLIFSLLTFIPFSTTLAIPAYAQDDLEGTVEGVTTEPLTRTGDNVLLALCAGFTLLFLSLMIVLLYLLLTRRNREEEVYNPNVNGPYPTQQAY